MLLIDTRLSMFFAGQFMGCYRSHTPRAEFSKKVITVSDGKVTREEIDFIHGFSKDNDDFYKSAMEELVDKCGESAVLRLIAALDKTKTETPFFALFHDAEYGYDWHTV